MSVPLPVMQPMNAGDLLDHAISVYRKNFLAMVGIVAVISVPLLLIDVLAALFAFPTNPLVLGQRATSNASPDLSLLAFPATLAVTGFIGALTFVFQAGALSLVASEFFLGRRCTIKAAYGRALRRGLALFTSVLIIGLLNLVILSIGLIPFFAIAMGSSFVRSPVASGALSLLALCSCAAIVPAIILLALLNIHWIFTPQAIVIEHLGVRAGMGRSWRLVRGSFWRVFLIVLLMGVFIYLLTIAPSSAISVATLAFLPSPMLSNLASIVVQTLVNIFVIPIQFAILTMLYYDLRIRKEGFDLELRAKQLAESSA